MEWGVGTGVWMNVYYDLETGFLTETLESARYIGDGVAAIMRDEENQIEYWNEVGEKSMARVVLDIDVE